MNKDSYKKALDQIHASEKLKAKTMEKIREKQKSRVVYPKYLAACAMFLVVVLLGANYFNTENNIENNIINTSVAKKEIKIATEINDLPRFKNIQELKSVLKQNGLIYSSTNSSKEVLESADESISVDSESSKANSVVQDLRNDFSTTNVQVENVDEADIVKTDGDYIYYVTQQKVYIINANSLEILSIINKAVTTDTEYFSPQEIFINGNKLVVFGNSSTKYQSTLRTETKSISTEELAIADVATVSAKRTAKALIYDISDKSNPVLKREIELDGSYSNSRMIGDNIYFISTKYAYYNSGVEDYEILPICKDTAVSEETKRINSTDIAYFEGTESYSFTLVAGFNINNDEGMYVETFFGASNTVYCSDKNLYLAQVRYENGWRETSNTIYKFNLEDSKVVLKCQANVKGNLNNQFSLDEYDGNLRIATTSYVNDETSNNLYILDKDLKEIGRLEGLAPGEKIYSVRFIGKVGYVVTFKQVDPLFVIDLSDPTNPVVKGELKIPGYSSYLHPYDENHIIGIGYNTETNKYGNTTNTSMKMSMFDITDLENPKEMFSINIGDDYTYSEVLNNHKALFYNKSRNLIGFPATIRENNSTKNAFVVYKIDLENGFEEYGQISQKIDYRTNIDRAIYIEDILYTLSDTKLVTYNLNTMNKLNELIFVNE